MPTRTRIAPSPTGFPHVGTIFQALFDYVLARQDPKGKFIVRIEDTDQTRKVEGAEEALFKAFTWAGLEPNESSKHGGDHGPYRQSERLAIYQKYAQQLINQGDAYYCFCSPERLDQVRKQMQSDGQPPMYDKHCRNLDPLEAKKRAETENYVIRMKIPADTKVTFTDQIRGEISFDSNTVDDQVLLKSDGFPTYHLAVVVDDRLMEITHVVRGEEWISSTPKHVLLYKYFNWQMPLLIHTPLLRNPNKSKLGKRHGHASVTWYQEQGYLPEAVINFLTTRVWNHPEGKELFSIDETIKHFRVENMNIQGPIVDLDKLNWYNGLYIRALDNADLLKRLKSYKPSQLKDEILAQVLPLIKDRLVKLSDLAELTDFLYEYHLPESKLLLKKADKELVSNQLQKSQDCLVELAGWNHDQIESVIRSLQEEQNWHRGQYFMMLRLAATGKSATPPLFESIAVIGQDETLKRLKQTQQLIS